MEKPGGTSEEDEEEEMEMEMEVKEEEEEGGGYLHQEMTTMGGGGGGRGMGIRRCRPKEEMERTKLRERHRRAITARILAGLRLHGNYNLRVRADINEVIAALAREAGWTVLPNGTTYPSRSSSSHQAGRAPAVMTPVQPPPLRGVPPGGAGSLEYRQHYRMKGVYTPPYDGRCRAPVMMGRDRTAGSFPAGECVDASNDKQDCEEFFERILDNRNVESTLKGKLEHQTEGIWAKLYPEEPFELDYANSGCGMDRISPMRPGAVKAIMYDLVSAVKRQSSFCYQVIDIPSRVPEHDFAGTPYVPIYVMLPLGIINTKCELVDPDGLMRQLKILKSVNVDGVMVDCWWGIVEAHEPQEYSWHGYKQLFQIVRELKLKLQVVMSFHECGGNVGDDVCIPLPHWVAELGRCNPDIFFTDREGKRNSECLSWGVDKERVLRGRTAVEVYFDYMRSFRVEFDEFFEDGVISEIEVGLGPCGELRYPSYTVKNNWRYPGIGEFQCYDQYLLKSLRKAAETRGHSFWAKAPDNVGCYNSRPQETGFFCDGGDYDSYYGRFFLAWYSQVLIEHADRVLSLAKLAFEGTRIAVKLSGIHWWYKTASHAAELTAGFYNPCNRDGYASIASMLKKHSAALNFTCVELRTLDQYEDFPEAMADPEGLVWQVLNAAWDVGIPVATENALPCYDRDGYNKILENAKPVNDPDGRHLQAFTYLRLSSALMERHNFLEFERFVKRMHGEAVLDLQA